MKLYVVVDGSLPPGDQIAQSVHAVAEYAIDEIEPFCRWHQDSNTVVCLATKDRAELIKLRDKLWVQSAFVVTDFYEPDLDNRLTAIAFIASKNPCGHLPLAPRFGSSMAEQ